MTNANKTPDIHAASNAVIAKMMASSKPDTTAKAGSNPAGVLKRTSAYFIDPTRIVRREGWNNRFDMGEIEELAKSIKAQKAFDGHGIINDIRVKRCNPARPDADFELVDGDRRLTAIELLIKRGEVFADGIPAKIEAKDATDLDLRYKMFEANTGKPLLPLEEASAYKSLREAGQTIKQICERVGRKQVHVVATLALLDADAEVQDAVASGAVNSTMAKNIAVHARGDKAKQKELIDAAKSAGKDKGKRKVVAKAIEAARRAKAASKGKTLKIRALTDDDLSALGAKMAAALKHMMTEYKLPLTTDMRAWVKADDNLAMAFTFGALEALKAAAGAKVDLDI